MSQTTADSRQPYLVVDSPYQVARWRPLVNWILYVPHAIILYGLQVLARVVFFVYWLMLVFTGTLHPGMYRVMAMYERYNARAGGFLCGFSEVYPPFDFTVDSNDDGEYAPIRLHLPDVPEAVRRGAAWNLFKAIPQYVVLMVYIVAAAVVAVIGWFAVLFTGAWPAGMRGFLVRVSNYHFRIWTYVTMVDNTYPPFALPPTSN